jgi:hypothetical protein
MNELIKQAAEEYAFQVPYNGTNEFYDAEKLTTYKYIINHFLSFIKKKGVELVRVEGDVHDVCQKMHREGNGTSEIVSTAFAHGAAKERERMGDFAEWAGRDYVFIKTRDGREWWEHYESNVKITTSELMEIFNQQNKEG